MNANAKVTSEHLKRRAIVYIRQSSPIQVANNLESERRQYALADEARQLGFQNVETIDEDLGRSGSGQVDVLVSPGSSLRCVRVVWPPCFASRLHVWRLMAAIGII